MNTYALRGMGLGDWNSFLTSAQNTISSAANIANQVAATQQQFNTSSGTSTGGGGGYAVAPATSFSANTYAPTPSKGLSTGAKIAIGGAAAALLGTIVYMATKKKKHVAGFSGKSKKK